MAHFATGFVALGLLALVPAFPAWGMALLVIPVVLSVAIVRLRTVADRETVTARTLLGSRTVRVGRHRRAALRQERLGAGPAAATDRSCGFRR